MAAKKNKLPIAKAGGPVEMPAGMTAKMAESERRYRAEEALRDIERAEKHKMDKSLMSDVKKMAKEKVKALGKICD
jgi:hypothetical protein